MDTHGSGGTCMDTHGSGGTCMDTHGSWVHVWTHMVVGYMYGYTW